MREFLSDVTMLRQRVRQHLDQGPVTAAYKVARQQVIAVRIAVESYSGIIQWLGNDDPTTRKERRHNYDHH